MIWLILGVIVALVLTYVAQPLLAGGAAQDRDEPDEMAQARGQLAQLDADLAAGRIGRETADETRRALELRVLDLLDAAPTTAGSKGEVRLRVARVLVPLVLVVGSFGLYGLLGQPDFERLQRAGSAQPDPDASLSELVDALQLRLSADPQPPPQGYLLLARSLMSLERFDDAFAAYESLLALTSNDPQVQAEYDRAKVYAATGTLPPLDPQVTEMAQDMSEAARAEMVNSMVERLATRLRENPQDPEGWVNLIRSRVVLGQQAEAEGDLAAALQALGSDPDGRRAVLDLAGQLGLDAPDDRP